MMTIKITVSILKRSFITVIILMILSMQEIQHFTEKSFQDKNNQLVINYQESTYQWHFLLLKLTRD